MEIKTEFITGKVTGNQWSGVHGYRPEDSMDKSELFAVLRISTESEETDLERIASFLFDEIQESYYLEEKKAHDNIERLENAVWKMKTRMDIILSREEKIAESGIDIEMAVVVVEKDFLFASVIGESKIYIKRGESFVDITKGLIDGNMSGFLKSGSLRITMEDKLMITTSKASEEHEKDLNEALTELNINKLKEFKEISGVAILIFANEKLNWSKQVTVEQTSDIFLEKDNKTSELSDKLNSILNEETPVVLSITSEEMGLKEDKFLVDNINSDNLINNEIKPVDEKKIRTPEEIRSERLARLKLQEEQNESMKVIEQKEEEDESSIDTGEVGVSRGAIFKENISNMFSKFRGIKFTKEEELEEEEEGDLMDDSEVEKMDVKQSNSDIKLKISNILNTILKFFRRLFKSISEIFKNIFITIKKNDKTYARYFREFSLIVKNLIGKLWEIFKEEIIGTSSNRKDKVQKGKRRRRNRILLAIILVVLVIFIVIWYRNRQAQIKEQGRRDAVYSQVLSIQNELGSISSQVNNAKSADIQTRAAITTQLDNINKEVLTQLTAGLYTDQLNKLQTTIQADKDTVNGVIAIIQPNIITDIGKFYTTKTLIANPISLAYSKDSVYISDDSLNEVLKAPISSGPSVAATEFAKGLFKPSTLVTDASGNIIFYDSPTDSSISGIGIIDVNSPTGNVTRYPNLSLGVIGAVDAVAQYQKSGALYEIHSNHQMIFKRVKAGKAYDVGGALYIQSNPPNWKTTADLEFGTDISVPYEVYVLVKGIGLERFLAGGDNSINFSIFQNTLQSDYDSIAKATCMVATDKYLVICDSLNQRVMLFSIQTTGQKNIQFLTQYKYEGADPIFKNLKKAVLSDDQKSIYVLDGSRVIGLDITQ